MPTLANVRKAHVNRQRARYNAMRQGAKSNSPNRGTMVVRQASPNRGTMVVRQASPSPRRANANLYGRPQLRRGQVKRIVSLIISLMIMLYLTNYLLDMSLRDGLKMRKNMLTLLHNFKEITQNYFTGYEKSIEAAASGVATVIARKFTSGSARLNISNLAAGATAATLTMMTGTGSSNFIKNLSKYNNSVVAKLTGRTLREARAVQNLIISMIAWLISALKTFAVTNVGEIVNEELRVRKITGTSPRALINSGVNNLRLGMN